MLATASTETISASSSATPETAVPSVDDWKDDGDSGGDRSSAGSLYNPSVGFSGDGGRTFTASIRLMAGVAATGGTAVAESSGPWIVRDVVGTGKEFDEVV